MFSMWDTSRLAVVESLFCRVSDRCLLPIRLLLGQSGAFIFARVQAGINVRIRTPRADPRTIVGRS
jgi:hypothetical protein